MLLGIAPRCLRLAICGFGVVVLAAACSGPSIEPGAFGWERCGQLECGSLAVPVDHDNINGETLELAVSRSRSEGTQHRGVLFLDSGGPGASNRALLEDWVTSDAAELARLREVFDIVAVDARGVGGSEPEFGCGENGEFQDLVDEAGATPNESSEIAAGEAAIGLCVQQMGNATAQLGTGVIVRDLEAVRTALGEEQVFFFGYSFGSVVGAWYASEFPESVRLAVVDGASPSQTSLPSFEQELAGFRQAFGPLEEEIQLMLSACADDTCPVFNDGDPTEIFVRAFDNGALIDEEVGVAGAQIAAAFAPLRDRERWSDFYNGLDALDKGDATPLAETVEGEFLQDDVENGSYVSHVLCLNFFGLNPELDRSGFTDSDRQTQRLQTALEEEFPLIAQIQFSVEIGNPCRLFDSLDPPSFNVDFTGGNVPFLVVANRSDPITNFADSMEFTEQLTDGHLVDVDFPRHTVFPDDECVNAAVIAALVDDMPLEATLCE